MGWWRAWQIASDILLGAAATCALNSCLQEVHAAPPPPKPPIVRQTPPVKRGNGSQHRIETQITSGNRCMITGYVNGRGPLEFLADSGAPDVWLPVGDLPKIGIARSSLSFSWFGPRERNVAWVTLPEVRIGDYVARNVNAAISEGEDMRLLGMSVLKQGHMEIQGDTCTLTFAANAATQTSRSPAVATGNAPAAALNLSSVEKAAYDACDNVRCLFAVVDVQLTSRLGRKPTAQEIDAEIQRHLGWR
jgi:predicted aspartyl protease